MDFESKRRNSGTKIRRRERPRKLRLFNNDCDDGLPRHENLYEPQIDSFLTACIAPGISSGNYNDDYYGDTTDGDDGGNSMTMTRSNKRAPPIRLERSLPLLSSLATTTIAKEKKRLRIEEEKRKELEAAMEAQKALALNPMVMRGSSSSGTILVGGEASTTPINNEDKSSMNDGKKKQSSSLETQQQSTTILEHRSRVTMPPLLEQFLMSINNKKAVEKKEGIERC